MPWDAQSIGDIFKSLLAITGAGTMGRKALRLVLRTPPDLKRCQPWMTRGGQGTWRSKRYVAHCTKKGTVRFTQLPPG
jgi:hypothetical protein